MSSTELTNVIDVYNFCKINIVLTIVHNITLNIDAY